MLTYPNLDPILLQIGPLAIRWYGMMYTLAFLIGWPLLLARAKRFMPQLHQDTVGDLLFWILLGVLLGGRLGYIFFYQFEYYLDNPLAVLRIWEGGMAFHGGLLGVLTVCLFFSRRHQLNCLSLADLVAPIAPIGFFLGRIGNFINGELWGRTTDLPWGMIFPNGGPLPRHPSQLYQSALEGLALFLLLQWLGRVARPPGFLLGWFLAGYGLCRFVVEFVREPDPQLGLLALDLTMGQWLSLPMIVAGLALWRYAQRGQ
ncbi:MAG: prolipoprotein diacylglyceryl transferase [Magnetococcales bacterium]|nr:prolipoprotein diacylglyceryl transferase [Magnetococcales bacterium]MBF0116820.1 prolipoprotein diacylglyceryl transferase [Magnetococcales bacterium]